MVGVSVCIGYSPYTPTHSTHTLTHVQNEAVVADAMRDANMTGQVFITSKLSPYEVRTQHTQHTHNIHNIHDTTPTTPTPPQNTHSKAQRKQLQHVKQA